VYPLLESYIAAKLIGGTLKAVQLHRSNAFAQPYLYASTTSRYCPVLLREHASNHVQVEVNVLTCMWRFRCLDPQCDPCMWQKFDAALLDQLHPAVAQQLAPWHAHWASKRAASNLHLYN